MGDEDGNGSSSSEVGGQLLFCGVTDWAMVGRSDTKKKGGAAAAAEKEERAAKYPNVISPHRLPTLNDVKVTFVAAGCSSTHCIALDIDGRCFTWGRNEAGQLGAGDLVTRNLPTVVAGLSKHKVVKAASGKSHTVVVTETGDSFSFGFNKHGQLGTGSLRNENEKSPVKALVSDASQVACGAEFTIWIASEGTMSCGLPQYGQLGHGTDKEYNAKEGSVKLMYEPQPTPAAIKAFAGKTITKIACGNNHTVAADSEGRLYTWGFGGHGRLGHKEQKDEFTPRQVEIDRLGKIKVPENGLVAAGSGFSAATVGEPKQPQLYMWGRVKPTGDNWMYPKPVMDLSGWNIRHLDCGSQSTVVAADESCISWGTAQYGELGYGPKGQKSSANPKKIDDLEGTHIVGVACGAGHTLFIADRSKHADKIDKLPEFEAEEDEGAEEEDEEEEEEEAPKGRGRGRGKAAPKRGKGKADAAAPPAKKAKSEPATKPRGRGRGKK